MHVYLAQQQSKAIWPFVILALWVLPALLGQLLCTSGFGRQ